MTAIFVLIVVCCAIWSFVTKPFYSIGAYLGDVIKAIAITIVFVIFIGGLLGLAGIVIEF